MPNPYEFGYAVGALTKTAQEKQARGMIADMALYSNPFSGVPTGLYDTYKNIRAGKYLNAAGSAASGAMSLFGVGGIGGGVRGAGNVAMRAGMGLGRGTTAGRALVNSGRALRAGGKAITTAAAPLTAAGNRITKPIASAVQKVMPVRQTTSILRQPVQSAVNYVASNPVAFAANHLHSSNHTPQQPAAAQPQQAPVQAQVR